MSFYRPNRPHDVPQLEICDLCGLNYPASMMIDATAEGLAGTRICPRHPPGQRLGVTPSYNDLGGSTSAVPPPGVYYPHSGTNWYNTPY